ncbi:28S ribosomal protein S14, mitochondrial [Egretta garzetta]|uniref:28S ribosomal protein S14, mitochondrial n=1 Tax=Egretta garzetta TaxID=188379 RepID=UPI00051F0DE4|nr:28S ribosomal protein S14, mitochondrial [Egretta garzetta]
MAFFHHHLHHQPRWTSLSNPGSLWSTQSRILRFLWKMPAPSNDGGASEADISTGIRSTAVLPSLCTRQVRSYYVDWRMLRREVADKEIADLPRDSCPVRIRNRCVLTSRPRGVKRRWRLSRIVFRHFADHAQMSGIQRAMW